MYLPPILIFTQFTDFKIRWLRRLLVLPPKAEKFYSIDPSSLCFPHKKLIDSRRLSIK